MSRVSSTSPLHLDTHAHTHTSVCLSPPVPTWGRRGVLSLGNYLIRLSVGWLAVESPMILHSQRFPMNVKETERSGRLQGFKAASGYLLLVCSPMARRILSLPASLPFPFFPSSSPTPRLTYFLECFERCSPRQGERTCWKETGDIPPSKNNMN